MSGNDPGKLKYINGIPYLTGHHVEIDEGPPPWHERLLAAWQRTFGPRLGNVLLVIALVALIAGVGALIDYLVVIMADGGR